MGVSVDEYVAHKKTLCLTHITQYVKMISTAKP